MQRAWAVGVGCALAGCFGAPAFAFDDRAYDLLDRFEQVCVSEGPGFEAVPPKLRSIGFEVIETVPGVYEATSRRSAYTVFVTPALRGGDFASCALSVNGSSVAAAEYVLREFVFDMFGDAVVIERVAGGGFRYRVPDVGTTLIFVASGGPSGAALALEVAPSE